MDWNAARYHEISTPQQLWGARLLDRLAVNGAEHALDVGCGTGRLTALLARRMSAGRVTATDRSASMLATAASWLREEAPGVRLVQADAANLPFSRAFDVVFSAATFHWIRDHAALFRSIIAALRPEGRLTAQCGGGPNLALLLARADALMRERRFANAYTDWSEPWYFADVESTIRRLAAAGFDRIDVTVEEAPASFAEPRAFEEFITTVCIRHHLEHLPRSERSVFARELTRQAAADDPPFTLDYWRLNISARRPPR